MRELDAAALEARLVVELEVEIGGVREDEAMAFETLHGPLDAAVEDLTLKTREVCGAGTADEELAIGG